ncbi:YchJ family protein [Nonlabens marinus]|uniref:UPF0225 protein YchJ n=1 Tax=Nonlabens marinus S1-08 TaxID=1454201 RepID=W8VW33_9FLAO|nr:YchJ family metal-binding protein [Nonlabens marinus]BAO55978.1 UPF0225 protein YchJ [Nonlabens marinus S1-08]
MAHKNIHTVITPEQLMRSRYSAFVLADVDYLQLSQHSSQRLSKKEAKELKLWTKSVTWIRLEVLQTTQGLEDLETGRVEFKAHYLENSRLQVIHENSKFCKENGHWVYLEAI